MFKSVVSIRVSVYAMYSTQKEMQCGRVSETVSWNAIRLHPTL